jgi:hypothetical protein
MEGMNSRSDLRRRKRKRNAGRVRLADMMMIVIGDVAVGREDDRRAVEEGGMIVAIVTVTAAKGDAITTTIEFEGGRGPLRLEEVGWVLSRVMPSA